MLHVAMKRTGNNQRWTAAHDDMLRADFAAGLHHQETADHINIEFATNYSVAGIAARCWTLGLRRPGPRPKLIWSRDMDDKLRDANAARHTIEATRIALAVPYSAVVTRIAELGLTAPGNRLAPGVVSYVEQRRMDISNARRLNALMNFVPARYRVEAPLPVCEEVVTDPLNLTLEEIGRKQCHWIMNDDAAAPLYCGHDASGSWCPAHRAVVIRQPNA